MPDGSQPLYRAPDLRALGGAENDAYAFVIAHPLGHPAEVSSYCGVYPRSSLLYHTCYTRGGSSGAAIWWDDKKEGSTLGIHTRAVRDCANPDDAANQKTWREFRDDPANGEIIGRFGEYCVGGALSIGSIYCNYCKALGHAREASCQEMESLLPVDWTCQR
jgi:hypothetical protein